MVLDSLRIPYRPLTFKPVLDLADDGESFLSVIQSFGWILALYMNDAATPIVNHGSLGATGNGALTNGTTGGAAVIPNLATVVYDGLNTCIVVANNAAFNALQTFTYVMIFHALSGGEGTGGRLFHYNEGSNDHHIVTLQSANSNLLYRIDRATTDSTKTSTTANLTYPGTYMIAMRFSIANDVTVLKWAKGASALTDISDSPPAGAGAVITTPAVLNIGANRATTPDRTFNGRYAFFGLIGSYMTDAQLTDIAQAANLHVA